MAQPAPPRLRKRQIPPILYDRATKTTKDLLPKFDNWVDEFAWATPNEPIYFTSADRGKKLFFAFEPQSVVACRRDYLVELATQRGSGPGEFKDLRPSTI